MQSFLLALKFLTTIPIETKLKANEKEFSQALIYFPLVGLVLGLILSGVNRILLLLLSGHLLVSALLVVLLILLTGGLHLDGLADTFDALSSGEDKQKMRQIMRDCHLGTMGVLSLICVILLKLSLLYSLQLHDIDISLILMCLLSRFALVLMISLFPYARTEGKAKAFFAGINQKIFALATAITLVCSVLLYRLPGLVVFFIAGTFAILVGRFIAKKLDGMTGDTLGAINELTEVFVLLTILILNKL